MAKVRVHSLAKAIVPVLLGGGERLFEDLGADLPDRYECVERVASDAVTHVSLVLRGVPEGDHRPMTPD